MGFKFWRSECREMRKGKKGAKFGSCLEESQRIVHVILGDLIVSNHSESGHPNTNNKVSEGPKVNHVVLD